MLERFILIPCKEPLTVQTGCGRRCPEGSRFASIRGRPHHWRIELRAEPAMKMVQSDRPFASADRDLRVNPMGTDGFEFVEYIGPDPQAPAGLVESIRLAGA